MPNQVLVADGSSTMRTIIARSLRTSGASVVVEAASCLEAMELFSPERFALVIVDLDLDQKHGLDLVEAIRVLDTVVPILILTQDSIRANVLRVIRLGATDCLLKPFTTDTLRDHCEGYFRAATELFGLETVSK